MKCPKCGEECNSGVWFCDACGCNLKDYMDTDAGGSKLYSGEENDYFEYRDLKSDDEGKPHKTHAKKKKKGGLVSVLLVVSLLVILSLVGVFVYQMVYKPDYERKLDKIIALVNEHSADVRAYCKAVLPEKVYDDYMNLVKAECEEEGKNADDVWREANIKMKESMDELETTYGSDYRYDMEIENERKLSKDELKDIADAYTQMSQFVNALGQSGESLKEEGRVKSYEAYQKLIQDISETEFDEGYELEVTLTLEDEDQDSEDTVKIYMVKTDGQWVLGFKANIMDRFNTLMGQYFR